MEKKEKRKGQNASHSPHSFFLILKPCDSPHGLHRHGLEDVHSVISRHTETPVGKHRERGEMKINKGSRKKPFLAPLLVPSVLALRFSPISIQVDQGVAPQGQNQPNRTRAVKQSNRFKSLSHSCCKKRKENVSQNLTCLMG